MVLAACTSALRAGGTGTPAIAMRPQPAPRTPTEAACANAPQLVPGIAARGNTSGQRDLFHATCAYGAASPDAVYRFHLDRPSHVALRVQGNYDTAVYLRAACDDVDSEVACNDDASDARHSAIEADLPPGDYFAFVDGYASGSAGFYTLTMSTFPAPVTAPLTRVARVPLGEGATVEHVPGQQGITGTVTFAKRTFTPRGLSRDTTETPAPHFVVEAVSERGLVVASAETDERGRFALQVEPGSTVRIRAVTRTAFLGNDIRVVSDAGSEGLYEVSTAFLRVQGNERVTLRAGVGGVEPAGAFNILAQFVRYLPHVQRGFDRPLPPLYAFWRRGNNRTLPMGNITAFLLDYHRHEGTYALQIQGGDPGHEDQSDSDQFDDPVILHEFSHFIVHTMAGHYTLGGVHQDGELHFPGQALDEGAATAMGCAVAQDPHYWDSAGLEPTGRIIVDDNIETPPIPDRGIGSQNSAMQLVWDLIDGAEDVRDGDNDGVAVGLSGVMHIYASFRDDPDAIPGIHTVIERAVDLHLISAQQASQLVRVPIDHGFSYPLRPDERWPIDLPLPGEVRGQVDGMSQPAPSGGRNIPWNGFDAIRTYRVRVTRRQVLNIELSIDGPGTQASGTDLDLQLLTRHLQPLARAEREGPIERIARMVDPGTYIILVRDGDTQPGLLRVGTPGNRAAYTLRVR